MSDLRKWLKAEHGRLIWLASAVGVTNGAISQWADGKVPPARIFKVSEITGIPLYKLRPDIIKRSGKAA